MLSILGFVDKTLTLEKEITPDIYSYKFWFKMLLKIVPMAASANGSIGAYHLAALG